MQNIKIEFSKIKVDHKSASVSVKYSYTEEAAIFTKEAAVFNSFDSATNFIKLFCLSRIEANYKINYKAEGLNAMLQDKYILLTFIKKASSLKLSDLNSILYSKEEKQYKNVQNSSHFKKQIEEDAEKQLSLLYRQFKKLKRIFDYMGYNVVIKRK